MSEATSNFVTFELGGVLGKRFGKEHKIKCANVRQGLGIIDCNRSGFLAWMKLNANKYQKYHIRVTKTNGAVRDMSEDEFKMENQGELANVRVTPIYRGSGGKILSGVQIAVGVALILVGAFSSAFTGGASISMMVAGASMLASGVIGLLSKQPKIKVGVDNRKNSTYFDGPQNTIEQGDPVPLIYGDEILVGSKLISLKLSVDQIPT